MIGLYVQHDILRAVDIIRKRYGYIVTAIAENPVQLPVPDRLRPLTSDEANEYLENFSKSLQTLLSQKGFSSDEIAVAIDSRNAFIHTVPFDGNFSPVNVKKIIEWELSQYFPDIPSKEFLFDTYNPGFNPTKDKSPKFIYTAVLRSYIHLLQRGIRLANKQLLSINIDQFAIDNLLKFSAGSTKRERLNAVCYRRNDILYCSLLWNHRMVRYREYIIDEEHPPEKRLSMFLASASGPQRNIEQRIFYHPLDETIIDRTEQSSGWKFDNLKPFDKLTLKRKAKRNFPESLQTQEAFAPAVSVVLKGQE